MNNQNSNHQANLYQTEIRQYVDMMKAYGITTIVAMNRYLSRNNMWKKFDAIKRMNTYTSGNVLIGISVEAYKEIMSVYETGDVATSRLVKQSKVSKNKSISK